MKEGTANWLNLIMKRADEKLSPETFQDAMMNATMPFAEADADTHLTRLMSEIEGEPESSVQHQAIDWVRFGNLLQDALGESHTQPTE